MSVNKAYRTPKWAGRYKTQEYKEYERCMMFMLPAMKITKEMKLWLNVEYYFKTNASDIDNPTKPFLDILQKRYGFNDNQIWVLNIKKHVWSEEKIEFELFEIQENPQ